MFCNCSNETTTPDKGGEPTVSNICKEAMKNNNFRSALWTGEHLQMTLMCIPVGSEIGTELHDDTDQFIRVEDGCACVYTGDSKLTVIPLQNMHAGMGVFIPAGTWHNIVNIGNSPLKLSSIYAPSHHPKGTIHKTQADAQASEV